MSYSDCHIVTAKRWFRPQALLHLSNPTFSMFLKLTSSTNILLELPSCDSQENMRFEGVDYFEMYAPVGTRITICLMLIVECLLDLKSKQGHVMCAFLHTHLSDDENVYVHIPQGFTQYDNRGKAKVLELKMMCV